VIMDTPPGAAAGSMEIELVAVVLLVPVFVPVSVPVFSESVAVPVLVSVFESVFVPVVVPVEVLGAAEVSVVGSEGSAVAVSVVSEGKSASRVQWYDESPQLPARLSK
jgi:hypothetical protein